MAKILALLLFVLALPVQAGTFDYYKGRDLGAIILDNGQLKVAPASNRVDGAPLKMMNGKLWVEHNKQLPIPGKPNAKFEIQLSPKGIARALNPASAIATIGGAILLNEALQDTCLRGSMFGGGFTWEECFKVTEKVNAYFVHHQGKEHQVSSIEDGCALIRNSIQSSQNFIKWINQDCVAVPTDSPFYSPDRAGWFAYYWSGIYADPSGTIYVSARSTDREIGEDWRPISESQALPKLESAVEKSLSQNSQPMLNVIQRGLDNGLVYPESKLHAPSISPVTEPPKTTTTQTSSGTKTTTTQTTHTYNVNNAGDSTTINTTTTTITNVTNADGTTETTTETEGPENPETVTPSGDLYDKKDKTFRTVIETQKAAFSASPLGSMATTFFSVPNTGGSCPTWSAHIPYIEAELKFDYFCLDFVAKVLLVVKGVLMVLASYAAFRIAMG